MNLDAAQRLAETVAWCSHFARAENAGFSTRNPALRPPVMALPRDQHVLRLLEPNAAEAAVDFVCEARQKELTRLGIPVTRVGSDFAGGRLLFTTIDTDSCCAATEESNGYYDLNDLPGWDTWFFHKRTDTPWGAIYCWVPAGLIELAQNGMAVIPLISVQWAQSLVF